MSLETGGHLGQRIDLEGGTMNRLRVSFLSGNSGSVAVIAALGIAVFMGFAAVALDVGHMISVKNELQRAADAGALAGVRAMWPATLPIIAGTPTRPDTTTALATALQVSTSANNKVDGATLPADRVVVQTGRWDYAPRTFTVGTGPNANAVRVITQVPASMFFAQVLGFGPINISATATALMDFANEVGQGSLPIAISQFFIVPGSSIYVNFTPDQLDNGAWFANPPDSASAKTFQDYINNASCPPLKVGDIINLQNGNDTSVLTDLQNKLSSVGGAWDVLLPVVDTTKFVGDQPITGFVPFRITEVENNGTSKGVTGTILGMYMSNSATPGGTNFGVLSSPKLL